MLKIKQRRYLILLVLFSFLNISLGNAQTTKDKKSGIVWSAGVFKSWLKDEHLGFNKIGDKVTPVFSEEKKTGFAIQSHYLYHPLQNIGIGIHLGMGIDVHSNIKAPVVLFGASLSFGNNNQFILDFGWADGKRKIIPSALRQELLEANYSEIPEIYTQTELNTGYYLGLSYKI